MAIDLLTGRVTGRYVFGVVDGADSDLEPDMIPATERVGNLPAYLRVGS